MIFKYITIQEGLFKRVFKFEKGANLIYSKENTKGKTSLLRFMLYSLGYDIPYTRNFNFKNCTVRVCLECEEYGEIILFRENDECIEMKKGNKIKTFVLPDQLEKLHEIIFHTQNINVLSNILGAIYADQEKGWTLLNRGTIIGSIHFNIEELIRGLSNCDCTDLLIQEIQFRKELIKYQEMLKVAKYRDNLIAKEKNLAFEDDSVKYDTEISQLLIQEKSLQKEINRIDRALNDNKKFASYIEEMKIIIKLPDGKQVPVDKNSIVGLTDSIDFLISKRKIIASQLRNIIHKINQVEIEQKQNRVADELFKTEDLIELLDKKIAMLPVNATLIEKEIKNIDKKIKKIRQEISEKTMSNSSIVNSLYTNMIKYVTELGVGNTKTVSHNYLFTSNLKELSGAVLHKIVFAFRLAYILEIEKYLKIKLPIILDSPSGKEIDPSNIQLMVNILKRDFADNQIIIASIFKYDFDKYNIIEIKNRLIEQ